MKTYKISFHLAGAVFVTAQNGDVAAEQAEKALENLCSYNNEPLVQGLEVLIDKVEDAE